MDLFDLANGLLDYLRWGRRTVNPADVAIGAARILHETAEEVLPRVWTYDAARKHVALIVKLRDFEHVLQAIQAKVVLTEDSEGAVGQYQLVHAAYLDDHERMLPPRETHSKGMKWFRVYLRSRFNPRFLVYTMDLEDRRIWDETWGGSRWHAQVPELLWEASAFPPLSTL